MASVKENKKNGKVVSYCFTAFFGRDEQGKQIRQYTTWTPPKGFGPAKAKKEAEKQAALWEQSLKQPKPPSPVEQSQERHDDLCAFIDDIWLPLQVIGRNKKPKTAETLYETQRTAGPVPARFTPHLRYLAFIQWCGY